MVCARHPTDKCKRIWNRSRRRVASVQLREVGNVENRMPRGVNTNEVEATKESKKLRF